MCQIAAILSGSSSIRKQATSRRAIARPSSFHPASTTRSRGSPCFARSRAESKGYPFEVLLPQDLTVQGAVLCDQIKSLDWKARRSRLAAKLTEATVEDILAKIRALLR